MGVFGDTLRQARAYKGVTLKEAEQATRINRHHLAALEEENFGVLPPLIYQRGIIRNYATYLDLDPGKLLGMFEEARGGETTSELVAAVKPLNMPSHWAPNFAIIAFMVVMSAIVFAWAYSAYFASSEATSTIAAVPPTVTPMDPSEIGFSSPAVPEQPAPAVKPSPTPRIIASQAIRATTTPSPTPRAVVTATPTTVPPMPTPTVELAPAEPTAYVAPIETVAEQPVEEPTSPPEAEPTDLPSDQLTIGFTPSADVYLTVIGDGTTLWDGPVGAGQSIGPFTASSFQISTSDSAATQITNYNTGVVFNMGASVPNFSLP
jgi:cytoskeleton protein RodZ